MANNCWYCRKGGLVDLYFAGRTGVCPSCGSGVNVKFDVEKFVAIDEIVNAIDRWAKSVCVEPNEPLTMAQLKALPDGTKVYCYKLVDGKLRPYEWEVCRTKQDERLVRSDGGFLFFTNIAIDSENNKGNRRAYLKEVDLSGDNNEKPLTTEELMRMNGQKVWCSVKTPNGEAFNFSTVGWYTVDVVNRKITGNGGEYDFDSNNITYGFRAYRTDQSHRANEEELPF